MRFDEIENNDEAIRKKLQDCFSHPASPRNYKLANGIVIVKGGIQTLNNRQFPVLDPIKFGSLISGDLLLDNDQLTSLVGCPATVMGSMRCNGKLINLEGAPQIIKGQFGF